MKWKNKALFSKIRGVFPNKPCGKFAEHAKLLFSGLRSEIQEALECNKLHWPLSQRTCSRTEKSTWMSNAWDIRAHSQSLSILWPFNLSVTSFFSVGKAMTPLVPGWRPYWHIMLVFLSSGYDRCHAISLKSDQVWPWLLISGLQQWGWDLLSHKDFNSFNMVTMGASGNTWMPQCYRHQSSIWINLVVK